MGGISLVDGTLVVERAPTVLDELAIRFTELLGTSTSITSTFRVTLRS